MMRALKARPNIQTMAPYVQGQSEIGGIKNPIKLSSNEAPFGPSPKALAVIDQEKPYLHRYPDGDQSELRNALARKYAIEPSRILCGNGSEELILLLIRTFMEPGDELVMSEFGFVMYEVHGQAQGAKIVRAPERNFRTDIDAILRAVTEKTKIVAIANPNNPTGTCLSGSEIERLHRELPPSVLLMIDSAYAEYATDKAYEPGLDIVRNAENAVMLRTFSKIYGLAGLRIGWAYCPQAIADMVQRIRTPFNTNRLALRAAVAALDDDEFVAKSQAHNQAAVARMMTGLQEIGLNPIPTETNFILVQFSIDSPKTAERAAAHLLAAGIIPRPMGAPGLRHCLRISIGQDHENEAALKALAQFMTA
ncbi:histidinol-phosphate transaminase [Govanella unica]|uniref:Histidinol-phosphate aminotransferase n=1 Tax=Govanella unica TaxID=2975056 RepID=A0A9X3Z8F5_9PROT|nr:histidinol-phosphate transaminase [Govania unica]MDA5195031.1 histidinol-phosphate transaminase [Govania unica]